MSIPKLTYSLSNWHMSIPKLTYSLSNWHMSIVYPQVGLQPLFLTHVYPPVCLKPLLLTHVYPQDGLQPLLLKYGYPQVGLQPLQLTHAYPQVSIQPLLLSSYHPHRWFHLKTLINAAPCVSHMCSTVGRVKFSEWKNTSCGNCKICKRPLKIIFTLCRLNCVAKLLQQQDICLKSSSYPLLPGLVRPNIENISAKSKKRLHF